MCERSPYAIFFPLRPAACMDLPLSVAGPRTIDGEVRDPLPPRLHLHLHAAPGRAHLPTDRLVCVCSGASQALAHAKVTSKGLLRVGHVANARLLHVVRSTLARSFITAAQHTRSAHALHAPCARCKCVRPASHSTCPSLRAVVSDVPHHLRCAFIIVTLHWWEYYPRIAGVLGTSANTS